RTARPKHLHQRPLHRVSHRPAVQLPKGARPQRPPHVGHRHSSELRLLAHQALVITFIGFFTGLLFQLALVTRATNCWTLEWTCAMLQLRLLLLYRLWKRKAVARSHLRPFLLPA